MQWIAFYSDGSSLSQYDEETGEHSSEQIDRSKLRAFLLFSDTFELLLHIHPGEQLIYRRRTVQRTGEGSIVAHLLGSRQKIAGEYVYSLHCVQDDGEQVEWASRFDPNHAWFYPVELVPCEMDEDERGAYEAQQQSLEKRTQVLEGEIVQ